MFFDDLDFSTLTFRVVQAFQQIQAGFDDRQRRFQIVGNIADELGDRSYSLFEESKSGLAIEYKKLLRDYHPDNHNPTNLKSIVSVLETMNHTNDPKEFLITGFTEYCSRVLEKVGGILGSQPLIKILDDIEKVLGYVKKYQAGSKEKSKIVNDMKHAIDNIHLKFKINPGGRSKGGIFSMFS